MSKARYLVEAHLLEGRPVAELALAHGVHRSWIYKLLERYRQGGLQALEPRSRAPRSCPHQIDQERSGRIVSLRLQLSAQGLDAGAQTIAYHLRAEGLDPPSLATIWRILRREGLVRPQPRKRPRSSLQRFCAELPNELWQVDITHWKLGDGKDVEIINIIDDHSRLLVLSEARSVHKATDVVAAFHRACRLHGTPASLLSDNGAVFTGAYRGGKVLLESELERLGVLFKNSRPYHPQTCGKVERLHQTLKRYLACQTQAQSLCRLQGQLDAFLRYYNRIRPHRGVLGQTPLQAYSARVKARPAPTLGAPHFRVRSDRVDANGKVTLRYGSRLHHIGLGRAHKGKAIRLLIAERAIRVVDLDGQLIRELTLDPERDYQGRSRE
ncbi:MAG TPA: IS481 family transposase [Solirubrobacteraceae bacterium]|nr:IS481 family transposase [Solirubrobacteraceae bacterium]